MNYKYEIVTVPGNLNSPESDHVIIRYEDGSFKSFPVDETNPEYVAFIQSESNNSE